MSNIIALNLHEREAEERATRYQAALADAMAEFKFRCRNEQEFFAKRYDEALETIEPEKDGLLDCLHRLVMNRQPGDDPRLVRELREQFQKHLQEMADRYFEEWPLEVD